MAKLTTDAEIQAFAGISGNDSLVSAINTAVSVFVEKYIGYTIASETYTNETYDGNGLQELNLETFPIITFSQLQERSAYNNQDDWNTVDSEHYYTDLTEGVITMVGGFIKGKQNYRVTYTAGYTETPADLELAVWQICRDIFNQRSVTSNVKSESLKDYTVSYGEVGGMVTLEVKQTLDMYRDLSA